MSRGGFDPPTFGYTVPNTLPLRYPDTMVYAINDYIKCLLFFRIIPGEWYLFYYTRNKSQFDVLVTKSLAREGFDPVCVQHSALPLHWGYTFFDPPTFGLWARYASPHRHLLLYKAFFSFFFFFKTLAGEGFDPPTFLGYQNDLYIKHLFIKYM